MRTTYVVMRIYPEPEPIAHLDDQDEARSIADALGQNHVAVPVPHVMPGQWHVVHTWSCAATVVDGQVEIAAPQQLFGASQLVRPGDACTDGTRTLIDQGASDLEMAVHGRRAIHLIGYGSTADQSATAVRCRADQIAAQP